MSWEVPDHYPGPQDEGWAKRGQGTVWHRWRARPRWKTRDSLVPHYWSRTTLCGGTIGIALAYNDVLTKKPKKGEPLCATCAKKLNLPVGCPIKECPCLYHH